MTTFEGSGIRGNMHANGTTAQFYMPSGLTFDATGTLIVFDYFNNAIRAITSTGDVSTVVSGFTFTVASILKQSVLTDLEIYFTGKIMS